MTNRRNMIRNTLVSDDEIELLATPYGMLVSAVLLFQTFDIVSKAIREALRSEGISVSQYITLWALLLSDQAMTPTKISRLLPIESQSVTALLDRLVESKLVTRRRSRRDRRTVRVSLTARGEQLIKLLDPSVRQVVVSSFEYLSIEERQLLDYLLRKIRDASATSLGANPSHLETTIDQLYRGVERIQASNSKRQSNDAKANS